MVANEVKFCANIFLSLKRRNRCSVCSVVVQLDMWKPLIRTVRRTSCMAKFKVVRRGTSSYSKVAYDNCPITVVTQLSIDRIDRLSLLCDNWDGFLVAAILDEDRTSNQMRANSNKSFFPSHSNGSRNSIVKLEERLGNSITSTCVLTTILLRRNVCNEVDYDSSLELPKHLYPINELRNIALAAAQTEFVLLLDVDCVLSKDALRILSGWSVQNNGCTLLDRLEVLRKLCIESPGAIVLPCFEASDGLVILPISITSSLLTRMTMIPQPPRAVGSLSQEPIRYRSPSMK